MLPPVIHRFRCAMIHLHTVTFSQMEIGEVNGDD
jgi:hypothetical protein